MNTVGEEQVLEPVLAVNRAEVISEDSQKENKGNDQHHSDVMLI